MRSITRLLAPFVLAVASAALCHAQSGGAFTETWKEFSSKAGRFSVLLPGTPNEHVRPVAAGPLRGDTHIFELQSSALYLVLYVDVPAPVEGPAMLKVILDTSRDTIFEEYGTRLLEEREIALNEVPGRYVKMEARAGGIIRMKTYVARNRVYSLMLFRKEARAPAGVVRIHDEAAARFLDSFKLLPDGPGASPK